MISKDLVRFFNLHLGDDPFPTTPNDDIVIKFRNGEIGFNPVLLRYHNLLLKRSQSYVAGYTQEELYQEMAFQMYKAIFLWNESDGSFMTYLYKVLDNVIKWRVRHESGTDKGRANHKDIESYEFLVENGLDFEAEWTSWGESELRSQAELIGSVELNPQEKVCVELLFEGKSKAEIAIMLNLTRTRITQIFRGMGHKFSFLLSYQ